jgi:tetratricopeptide (TPR) repeat protein
MINYKLAATLDPSYAKALNNLAWSLVSGPDDPWFKPAQGLALARKAVTLEPNAWSFLNTLGVAAFRTRDWESAMHAFEKSITFTGGGAHDLFFLAMTSWHQGKKKEAQTLYDRAVAWTENNQPNDPELRRFRAEASALLGQPSPTPSAARTIPAENHERLSWISPPDNCQNQSCSASCGTRSDGYSTNGTTQPLVQDPAIAIPALPVTRAPHRR